MLQSEYGPGKYVWGMSKEMMLMMMEFMRTAPVVCPEIWERGDWTETESGKYEDKCIR